MSLVALHWRSARKCHHHHAGHAHQDHQVHLVHPESLAHLAPTVNLAALEKMVEMDHPVQPDPTEHLVPPDRMERRDLPVRPPSLFQLPLVMWDPLAKMAHLVHQAQMVPLAQTEAPAQLETKAHPAQPDPLATMVLQETRDHQAQTDPRENRVYAPNIAPPMAVSSSKTEQGDKRSSKTLRRICYYDEKPVIFMSIVAFIYFVIFIGQFPQPQQSTILDTAAASPIISFGAF